MSRRGHVRYEDELSLIASDTYTSAEDTAELLAEYQEKANRLNAISGVYQRADRIITTDSELTVSVVSDPNMDTNAMSNGRDIIFNANLINDISNDNIMHLHGLNFHEVAHVLYSPRAGSDLVRFIKENKYERAVSILEEARAETLLVTKYPTTKLFLEASSMEYLVANEEEMGTQFPVITGRTYLPLEVRQAVADKFIEKYGADIAVKLHDLIHAYRTLAFPRDFDKAKELIARMAQIVGLDDTQCPFPNPIEGHGSMPTKGRPKGKQEQEQTQSKRADKEKDEPKEDLGKDSNVGIGGEGETIGSRDFTAEDKSIAKIINDRLSEIKADEHVKRTLQETRKAILNSDEVRSAIKTCNYLTVAPKPVAQGVSRRFAQELERIVRDNDPSWDRFNSRGKLNITRTMNPDVNAIRTHFDTWDLGNPNTDIEAVILTDHSGSMGYMSQRVAESAWIVKRGIEHIEGNVTVFTFDDTSKLVYDKSEKAKANEVRFLWASGSTNPIRALVEAERILTMSKKSIKILFVVTDGEWDKQIECDSIIKSLNDKGVITCMVFIGNYKYYKDMLEQSRSNSEYAPHYRETIAKLRHGAQIFRAVADDKGMLEVAQDLVRSTLNTNKRGQVA